MQTANWESLREKAMKFRAWSHVLNHARKYDGAFYLSHIGLEWILKAAIAKKNNGWFGDEAADRHRLSDLVATPRSRFLLIDISKDAVLHRHLSHVCSRSWAWEVESRTQIVSLTTDELRHTVEIYEELFQWIQKLYTQ